MTHAIWNDSTRTQGKGHEHSIFHMKQSLTHAVNISLVLVGNQFMVDSCNESSLFDSNELQESIWVHSNVEALIVNKMGQLHNYR